MQSFDTQKLLRSLAKLIEKPELKALQLSMIKTLSGIITAKSIMLYEIRTLKKASSQQAECFVIPVGYEDSIEINTSAPLLLFEDPLLTACFNSKNIEVSKIGNAEHPLFRSIHPILDSKGVTGFLVIDSIKLIQQHQDIASTLLTLYNNYLLLLNDNQRDHLTGLLNRKSFDDKIMQIVTLLGDDNKRAAEKSQFCLAVLDIDHFKRVNDTFGHLFGDEVLLHFSQCMNETFREYDFLFRVGGEEFVVVLRNVDAERAAAIMERFRHVIETHYFPSVGQITVSIGFTFIGPQDLPVTVMDRADKALYYVKEHGRNQTAFFEQLVATGKLIQGVVSGEIELF